MSKISQPVFSILLFWEELDSSGKGDKLRGRFSLCLIFDISYLVFKKNCQKLGSKYLVFWFQWELVEKVTSGGEGFFCVRQARVALCRL